MTRLFVAHKKVGESSGQCLGRIKRRYGVKKAGFSGTLDPFASGALIVAFGQYTKLFRFLSKAPKRYKATLWIGAKSPSLDIERIENVKTVMPFHPDSLKIIFNSLPGIHTYIPPLFSAKKVNGKRAYAMARKNEEVLLSPVKMEIKEAKLLHYCHPFITFEVLVSEGAYVRSIGQMISKKLGFDGALSALERLSEGRFVYENELTLNPLHYIDLPKNRYLKEPEDIMLGRRLRVEDFENQNFGTYLLVFSDFFSILEINKEGAIYHLNRMERC